MASKKIRKHTVVYNRVEARICAAVYIVGVSSSDPGHPFLVEVDDHVIDRVVKVVRNTWKSEYVGWGSDAKGLQSYDNIKVVRIQRIQNDHLYNKYKRKREQLRRKRESSPSSSIDVETDSLNLGDDLFTSVNECYLFHGTLKQNVASICEQGLLPGSESAMFGKGIYLAESPTKADQYTDPKTQRDLWSEKHMFLVRACLGKINFTDTPKDRTGRINIFKSLAADSCDSLVGSGKWIFREFVIPESCQVFPEFLITYKRVRD